MGACDAGTTGLAGNQKTQRWLYRETKLPVRKPGGRKRTLGTRRPMLVPKRPNERWSLDVVSDAFTHGRRLQVLVIVDDFSRECLALVTDTSLSGRHVMREPTATPAQRGRPRTIVSDNRTEQISIAVLGSGQESLIDGPYIAPGMPMRDTPSSRRSTAASETNFGTKPWSHRWRRPAR